MNHLEDIDRVLAKLQMESKHTLVPSELKAKRAIARKAIDTLILRGKIEELEALLRKSEVIRVDGAAQSYGLFNAEISDRLAELDALLERKND